MHQVFAQDIDRLREHGNSTIAEHEWSVERLEMCIRGPDGTMIKLKERTDFAVGDEVVVTYMIEIG